MSFILSIPKSDMFPGMSFVSTDQVREFVENEEEYWSWINESPAFTFFNQSGGAPVKNRINESLSQLNQQLTLYYADPDKFKDGMQGLLQDHFTKNNIPYSNGATGKLIERLRNEDLAGAVAALKMIMRTGSIDERDVATQRGAMLGALIELGGEKLLEIDKSKSMSDLEASLQQSLDDAKLKHANLQEAFDSTAASLKQEYEEALDEAEAKFDILIRTQSGAGKGLSTKLQEIANKYNQLMKLDAPVAYWRSKAAGHREAKYWRGVYLIVFAVVCAGALGRLCWWVVINQSSIPQLKEFTPAFWAVASSAILVTTSVFWVARILTKLYLSEHHLEIDAEERAVMVQTYLALQSDSATSEAERAIVLASLFRSTADGIVKDDAGPDGSIPAILARMGTRSTPG